MARYPKNFNGGLVGAKTAALLHGGGTSSNPLTVATANKNFMSYWVENSATSGDNRGLYLRQYIAGAGGGGEAARIFSTVSDVAAGTVHGAHISLSFGTSGTVTGQGIAGRFTLHMPATALASNVTMAAVEAEIYSDAVTSDPGGSTLLSYFLVNNGGNTTGGADVDDDVVLFDIQGHTIGAGNLVEASTTEANYSHSVKVRVGSTLYYMMLASAAG